MVGVVSANTQMVGVVQFFRGKMNDESVNGKSCLELSQHVSFLSSWRLEKYVNFIPPKNQPKPVNKQTQKSVLKTYDSFLPPRPIQKNQTRPLKDKNERIIPKVSKPRASNHHFPGSRFLEFEYQSSANVLTTECD